MKKSLLIILIASFLVMVVLLSQPRARHILFSGITHFPEYVFLQSMKSGLVNRNFDSVVSILHRHYELANAFGQEKNRLTPGLLENVRRAFKVAVLREERELFIQLLEKVVLISPENIDVNIMLARAYQYADVKKAFDYLEKARRILPSDQRIFHLANVLLRDSKMNETRREWCSSYQKTQFGDYEHHKSTTLLGQGYRRVAFEFSAKDQRVLFLNEGVEIGKTVKYEFVFDQSYKLMSPSVRFSLGGGLQIQVHSLAIFSLGQKIKTFSADSIKLFPETGFVKNDSVISVDNNGENVFFELFEIEKLPADKVILEMTIEKLALDNSSICWG
jgi:hypothetical protein